MDREFFIENANKYKDTIFRIAFNFFGNSYDADDMVQDVLLKLYETDKSFESNEHIRNWLIRVTVNECKSAFRLPWRKRDVSLDELTGSVEFEFKEESEVLSQAMNLSTKYRVVLFLFYYEEFSIKEISVILKTNESTITTRLSRARKKIKDRLLEVSEHEKNGLL